MVSWVGEGAKRPKKRTPPGDPYPCSASRNDSILLAGDPPSAGKGCQPAADAHAPKGTHPRRDLRPPARKTAIPLPAHAIPSAIGLLGKPAHTAPPHRYVTNPFTDQERLPRPQRWQMGFHEGHMPLRPPKPKVKGICGGHWVGGIFK